MPKTQNSNESLSWIKKNWIKILIIFGGIFLATGIIKSLSTLFNGQFGNGVADVLGAGANLVNGIVNGCTSQADCSIPTDQKTCTSSNGCSWQPGSTTGSPAVTVPPTCFSPTGRKPGSGNLFSTSCVLGLGFMAYLASILIVPLLNGLLLLGGAVKETVKTASRLRGTKLGEELKETTNKCLSASERAVKDLVDGNIEVDGKIERAVARMTSHRVAYNQERSASEGAQGISDAERAKEQSIADNRLQQNTEAERKANVDRFGKDKSDAIDKAAEKAEPIPESPI